MPSSLWIIIIIIISGIVASEAGIVGWIFWDSIPFLPVCLWCLISSSKNIVYSGNPTCIIIFISIVKKTSICLRLLVTWQICRHKISTIAFYFAFRMGLNILCMSFCGGYGESTFGNPGQGKFDLNT